MKVKIVLEKSRKDPKGYPIKLRITLNKKINYFSLSLKMTENEFNHLMNSKRLNSEQKKLKQNLIKQQQKAINIIDTMSYYDSFLFKAQFNGLKVFNNVNKLESCFVAYIDELTATNKIKTATMYQTTFNSLNRFKPNLNIDELNNKTLNGYYQYLVAEKKSITTISIYLRSLRSIINRNRDKIISYPFANFKIPTGNNNKRAINKDSLTKILNYNFKCDIDNRYLDLFKFSYYCAGINLKDILLLKHDNIQDDFIVYFRAKTGKQIKTFLLPQAKEIINKYKTNSNYLFNLILNDKPVYLHKKIPIIIKGVNRRLKRVCATLDIPNITTYSARHSFATNLMRQGVNIAFISQSLGHSSIVTTQNYLGNYTDNQMKSNMLMLTN